MRTGYVIGQQGGHQGHLRLYDGKRHLILYEGENGELADEPGVSYAGVSLVEGPDDGELVALVECEADATNRALLANLKQIREESGLPELPSEDPDGPFDGWF